MTSWLRSFIDVNTDESVLKAVDAREQQKEKLAQLTQQRNVLKKKVDENTVLGEKYKKSVQEQLNQRAMLAAPALDDYDSISLGKIMYDQIGQHIAKIYEMVYNAASTDMQNYGYRSKQFFSAAITADTLTNFLKRQEHLEQHHQQELLAQNNSNSSNTTGATVSRSLSFDHLVVPLLEEMSDSRMNTAAVSPLLEFAHEGAVTLSSIEHSILLLRENLSKHRARVGGMYSSGKRVYWESILDLLKFTTFSSTQKNQKQQLSLVEQADSCAVEIEMSSRDGEWHECLTKLEQLWTILAPTIRGHAGEEKFLSDLDKLNKTSHSKQHDDDFNFEMRSALSTSVPLLKSMFDVRTAVEQRLAMDFYFNYVNSMKIVHQHSFTTELFKNDIPTLPKQI